MDGQQPDYPFRTLNRLPEGYTWEDISYVIGGYWWKARFMDKEGYIVTDQPGNSGNNEYLNQWNYANPLALKDAGWVGYKSGTEKLVYDCGACHTTGYSPGGNQEDLPGIVGTWAEAGVQCEECHGPGSLHITNPQGVSPKIVRDAQQCSQCHLRGGGEAVEAKDGFIDHHEQYGDLFEGKHAVLDCVVCHDPHRGVKQLAETDQPTTRTACESCHFKQAQPPEGSVAARHAAMNVACIDCHMPRIIKTAWSDPTRFLGDMRSHRMAIDPTLIEQFYTATGEDGAEKSYAYAQISLNSACRHCHINDTALGKDDATLQAAANGFHNPPVP
jgi:hypothetical protein